MVFCFIKFSDFRDKKSGKQDDAKISLKQEATIMDLT